MIAVNDHATIGETFFRAADAYADKSFLAVPANPARAYDPAGKEITYAEAARTVRELMQAYSTAGYGVGHRIALLIENRPEHMLHKLAMNALAVCRSIPIIARVKWPMCWTTPKLTWWSC